MAMDADDSSVGLFAILVLIARNFGNMLLPRGHKVQFS